MKKRLSTGTKDSDSKKKRSKSETPVSLMNMPPMPAASIVESEMESLASELGLSAERLAALPLDQKWLLVCQSREKEGDSEVAEIVKKLSKGKVNIKEMIRIRTLLNSQPVGWVRNFLSKKGHTYLFEMFRNAAQRTKSPKARSNALEEDDMIAECCRAVKALMNFKEGFSRVLEIDDAMPLLLMSLEYINMVSQSSVLMVLAAVCVVSRSAQSRIVDDIRANKRYATIVNFMRTKDEDLKIGALTFINSILRGAEDSSSRCKLRAEFMKEGLAEVMKFVKQTKNDTLLTQLLVFDESLHGDSEGMELYKPKESSDKEYLKRIDSLEQKVKELTFENDRLKIELDKAKKAGPGLTGGIESLASNASSTTESTSSEVASTNAETDGGAPPPPPPPGDSGAPPPPPPPGGAIEEGGPPPPPPPPGGAGGPPPPPPPPGGGPPGPPPPPGAPAANRLPPKKKVQPGKKMRGFVWTQIADSKITDTVWEKLTDEKIKIDAKELEDLFAAAGPPPKIEGATGESGTPAGTAAAPKKPQVIHILDARKVNNIEIMLKGTKMAPGEIKSAVMSLDESVLTPDRLKAMKDFVPNAEEIKLLQDYPNKSELGNAEQYYLQIMDIPKLVQRINALVYKSNFEEKSQALIEETTHLKAALKSLKGNDRFLKVLEYILAIGNYLNGGTNRGGAYGFRLGSLAKLGEVKAQNGRDTLLHYLVEFIEKREKSLLSFVDELKSVQSAARVNIKETTGRITELKAGYEQLDRELKMPDVDAKFKGAMEGFVSKIGKIIQDLEKSATDIDTSFKDCLKFYGEPPATDAESFFGNISTFVAGFEKAQQDIIRNRQLAAKEELARQRELEREQLKTKRASTGTSNTTHSGLSGAPSGSPGTINRLKSKGALDDVINNLKAGQFGLRNTQSAEHKVFGNTNGPKRPLNFKE